MVTLSPKPKSIWLKKYFSKNQFAPFFEKSPLRVQIIVYPGRDHRQGDEDFLEKNQGAKRFFRKKWGDNFF